MTAEEIAHPPVVSREAWNEARKALLQEEKELTRARDRLNAKRRRLPMVRIEKNYVFRTAVGIEGYPVSWNWPLSGSRASGSSPSAARQPSTGNTVPLTKAAASESKRPTTPATSTGCRRGIRRITAVFPRFVHQARSRVQLIAARRSAGVGGFCSASARLRLPRATLVTKA